MKAESYKYPMPEKPKQSDAMHKASVEADIPPYTDQRKPRRKKGSKMNDDDAEEMSADDMIQQMEDNCINEASSLSLSLSLCLSLLFAIEGLLSACAG